MPETGGVRQGGIYVWGHIMYVNSNNGNNKYGDDYETISHALLLKTRYVRDGPVAEVPPPVARSGGGPRFARKGQNARRCRHSRSRVHPSWPLEIVKQCPGETLRLPPVGGAVRALNDERSIVHTVSRGRDLGGVRNSYYYYFPFHRRVTYTQAYIRVGCVNT